MIQPEDAPQRATMPLAVCKALDCPRAANYHLYAPRSTLECKEPDCPWRAQGPHYAHRNTGLGYIPMMEGALFCPEDATTQAIEPTPAQRKQAAEWRSHAETEVAGEATPERAERIADATPEHSGGT